MTALPHGWAEARLDDIAEVRLGRQRSPKNHTGQRMRPYLRAANVTWNGLDLSDVKTMNFSESESAIYELREGDLILAEASGSASEVGRPALWRGEIPGCCLQNTLIRVRAHLVEPRFLLHYFSAEARAGRIGDASKGVGIHHIGSQRLASWVVRVPPLNEQRRIVAAIEEQFSRLNAARTLLQSGMRRLEALRTLALDAVTRLDGDRVKTGDVAEVQSGIQKQPKRQPVENAYPFLRVANVLRGRLDLGDVHQVELFANELERLALKAGDLLVVEGNGSPTQIGRSALWRGEIENCVHQNHLIRIRPGPKLDPSFLHLYWNAPSTAERLTSVASSTSGLYTLSTAKVRSVELVVPTLDEQQRVVAEVEAQLSLIDAMRGAIETTGRRSANLSSAILDQAFSGQLVSQDPTDEPASTLLERISDKRASTASARRSSRRRSGSPA